MKKKMIIIGAFHEILELAEEEGIDVIGMIDNTKTGIYRSIPILCTDQDAPNLDYSIRTLPSVITPDRPSIRRQLMLYYEGLKFTFTTLISHTAVISKSATVATGTIVQKGVYVSADSSIGRFVKLNTRSNITHDVSIGDFTTIAPNAVVLGNVTIGTSCYVGAHSTILPHITVGDHAIIGAGAVVTKDVPPFAIVVGNPARVMKHVNDPAM